jgi:D-alanyl-D-alanine carboxypeptidase
VIFAVTSHPSWAAPYADIVVDGNSGSVLHETNPDAKRHPASLTKIMTLYLLFEQLEAGKLKLDSQLNVSKEASGQSPTKLGLKPGSTLRVEDAIKGIVTRSANDAAVVIADAIAGNEDDFAKLMTRKAQALGMTRTVYKNASGLPNDEQVTTARDQAMLSRAIQERFPRYYKYFSTRSFTFRGETISNHNHLLGRVEGVDGIKTGYTEASGFNLATSVHRGNRYLVAVVLGGGSAGSRDARMRELINDKISHAATKRTAPMIVDAAPTSPLKHPPTRVAKSETSKKATAAANPEGKVEPNPQSKPETAEADPEPRFAVASTTSVPARLGRPATQADPASPRQEEVATDMPAQPSVGSTEPIRPVLVKTLSVRAGPKTAPPSTLQVAVTGVGASAEAAEPREPRAPAAETSEAETAVVRPSRPSSSDRAAADESPAVPPQAPMAQASLEQTSSRHEQSLSEQVSAEQAGAGRGAAPKPQVRNGWMIQVGAYRVEQEAKQRLSAVQSKASKVLTGADAFTETFDKSGTTYYRARFAGLDKDRAEAACKYLKKNDVECVTVRN